MEKNIQGARWRRLDNTAKLFPVIANENLSNVFRISVLLKEMVVPEVLQQALEDMLPWFSCFRVRLRRGFFWYYFELNRKTPYIEKEITFPCKYIHPRDNQKFLFRVSYFEKKINLEVFHAVTDGMGAANFLQELTYRYLQLLRDGRDGRTARGRPTVSNAKDVEDSYLKNYKKGNKRRYSTKRAYQIRGDYLHLDQENIVHGYVGLSELKRVCKENGVSITKYLTACLIWSIYQVQLRGKPCSKPIGINLPINLRAFFDSETMANFFSVTKMEFLAQKESYSFEEILQMVSDQMDDQIVKEKLEETISYNVSNEKKWYLRIVPLCFKWIGLNLVFRRNDRANTATLSNVGPIQMIPEYADDIETVHMMIGVCKRQPFKCGVCAYGTDVVVTFASVFQDVDIQQQFFSFLKGEGIPVRTEGNGVSLEIKDRGMYPEISFDVNKWKKVVNIFYAVLFALAAILAVVNLAVDATFLWSGIAIGCIAYTAVTVRFSVMHHSDLGSKILIQTIGAQVLLGLIDFLTGYQGWSMNYAVPSIILFSDLAIVFLILVNRLNWQSYLMYQITVTVFSFIPILLWAVGLITNPIMAIITVILSVLILTLIILLGDRSVKNELIRRFHL